MEAVFLPDHSISAYNRSMNHMSLVNGMVDGRISGNLSHGSLLNFHGSLFGAPPSLSPSFSSLPPYRSSSFSSFSSSGWQLQKQPPLLPLPSAKVPALPSPPPPVSSNRKINKSTKDRAQEPKKAKSVSFELKKRSYGSTTTPKEGMGPVPSDLPTKVSKVVKSSTMQVSSTDELEEFSGSIFCNSPPPSSLPLPKFSLRPKSRCSAEAGGVDTGATDDLRRLLHLQWPTVFFLTLGMDQFRYGFFLSDHLSLRNMDFGFCVMIEW